MLQNPGVALEHDPEKWKPVFGQDHALTNSLTLLPAVLRNRRAGLLLPHVHSSYQ
jgi:hypothetical protein